MRKLIASLAVVAMAPGAFAASEVTNNAEMKLKYTYDQNKGSAVESTGAHWDYKAKVGFSYRSGEKLSAYIDAIYASDLGDNTTVAGSTLHHLDVNQAYASWLLSDDVSLKAGRMAIFFGDNTIFGDSEFDALPIAWDALSLSYNTEFAGLNFWAIKAGEDSDTTTNDERNLYVLSVDFKSLPGFLNMANLHVIQDNAQAGTDEAGNGFARSNRSQYGFTVGGEAVVDYRLTYSMQSGKEGAAEQDVKASLMDVELGYKVPWKNGRVHFGYHMDSGDTDAAGDRETYMPIADNSGAVAHNSHEASGLMDIVDYGNLTAMNIGAKFALNDTCKFGLNYFMFSATEKDAIANPNGLTLAAGEDAIGSELDLWASHSYDNGLTMFARLGMFAPGKALKDAGQEETHNQASVEAVWKF